MIQTKVLQTKESGLNFDIEPKEMIKPSGNANKSVKIKSLHDIPKPSSKESVIDQKFITAPYLCWR